AVEAGLADEPIDLGALRVCGLFLKEVGDNRWRHRAAPPVNLVRSSLQYPSRERTCQRGPVLQPAARPGASGSRGGRGCGAGGGGADRGKPRGLMPLLVFLYSILALTVASAGPPYARRTATVSRSLNAAALLSRECPEMSGNVRKEKNRLAVGTLAAGPKSGK